MEDGNGPVDRLCQQLSALHINSRSARATEKEQLQLQAIVPDKVSPKRPTPERKKDISTNSHLLPSSSSGCRPCWEPPVFDYTWFGVYLEAEKEVFAAESKKDGEWRFEIMNNYFEGRLMTEYMHWVQDQDVNARMRKSRDEAAFWKPFLYEVWMARNDIGKEFERINSRHNKSANEEHELHRRVVEIAEKNDPLFKSRMSQLQLI